MLTHLLGPLIELQSRGNYDLSVCLEMCENTVGVVIHPNKAGLKHTGGLEICLLVSSGLGLLDRRRIKCLLME